MQKTVVKIGKSLFIGPGHPIVVQTMCNTHSFDVEGTVSQCVRLAEAGAELIRITVPGLKDVEHIKAIKEKLRGMGIETPLVADIHFSSQTAIAVAPFVEKLRINPGNFHSDHNKACEQFEKLLELCVRHGTAIRIGVNHGSLGNYITGLYGNTPLGMAKAAMEWVEMCLEKDFMNVVVSLKSSNTLVMAEAYREMQKLMEERGVVFPLHIGVTEAGNGDSGRIKSCVGSAALLSKGIGATVRVSLTEDPVNEIPIARYLSNRYSKGLKSSLQHFDMLNKNVRAVYMPLPVKDSYRCRLRLGSCPLDREIDEVAFEGSIAGKPIQKTSLNTFQMKSCRPQGVVSINLNTLPARVAAALCSTCKRPLKK